MARGWQGTDPNSVVKCIHPVMGVPGSALGCKWVQDCCDPGQQVSDSTVKFGKSVEVSNEKLKYGSNSSKTCLVIVTGQLVGISHLPQRKTKPNCWSR